MKSKHEIPNKHDFMKAHSHNFLLNERYGGMVLEDVEKELLNRRTAYNSKQVDESDGWESNEPLATHIFLNMNENGRIDTITTGLSIITNSYIDYSGYTPKKYVTECHLKPKIGPFWYTESVTLHINSTKKKYKEKIYFMNKLHPSSWSEMMTIKTNDEPKNIVSECEVYIENPEPKEHVIHLQSLPVIEV